MSKPYRNILWDLDGTLTDPKIGILTSIRYALEGRGYPAPPMDDLVWCIGPPLQDSFSTLVPTADLAEVDALIAKYRERFSVTGLFENDLTPGITSVFEGLKDRKHFLATSKPHVFAKRILQHFNLTPYFAAIHGSELSGERSDKGDLIRHILVTENLEAQDCVMIGDRKHDIQGAKNASPKEGPGLDSIGVLWGYGSRLELEAAGANQIVDTPEALLLFLQS